MKNVLVLLLGVVIALSLCEVVLRVTGAAPDVVYIEKWRMRLARNPKIGYEPIPFLNAEGKSFQDYGYQGVSNSLGFRDREHDVRKKSGEKRIIILGDSVTAGLWIKKDEEMFSFVLEQNLKKSGKAADVMNFGVLGYNTQQEVETLREKGLRYEPDLVILGYCLNDRWRDDGHVFSHLVAEEINQSNAEKMNIARLSPWLAQSALLRFLKFRVVPAFQARVEIKDPQDPETFSRDTVAEYFGVLGDLSRKHGFEVLIAQFPDFVLLEKMSPIYNYEEEHDKIRRLSDAEGFQYLDLLSAFRACKEKQPDARIAFDRFHPTPQGNLCAGNALAEFILSHTKQSAESN